MSWIDTAPPTRWEQTDGRTLAQEKADYLTALRECLTVSAAARAARLYPRRVYTWREVDPQFLAAEASAREAAVEFAEAELYRRGVHGVAKPVYQSGKRVVDVDEQGIATPASVREYSDTALIFFLKGNRREVYGDRLDVSHHGMIAKAYQGVDLQRILSPADSTPAGEEQAALPLLPPGRPDQE